MLHRHLGDLAEARQCAETWRGEVARRGDDNRGKRTLMWEYSLGESSLAEDTLGDNRRGEILRTRWKNVYPLLGIAWG